MKYFTIVTLLLLASGISGCQSELENANRAETEQVTQTKSKEIRVSKDTLKIISKEKNKMPKIESYSGTIQFYDLEGGFYGITTKSGKRLLPLNLAEEFQQDGAEIAFSGISQTDTMTIQQWGTPFEIDSITIISEGRAQNNLER
ncbi:hypothetical protein [Aliikangiella sp. IMCC44632]